MSDLHPSTPQFLLSLSSISCQSKISEMALTKLPLKIEVPNLLRKNCSFQYKIALNVYLLP